MIDELRDFVPNVHFELIPIKDLVSNQEYQRNLSWSHVKKAVENFDLNQIKVNTQPKSLPLFPAAVILQYGA